MTNYINPITYTDIMRDTSHRTIYSKFKRYKADGEVKYRARENKHTKFSRDFYNIKGQAVFDIKVVSYKRFKRTFRRDYVSKQRVVVEKSFLSQNIRDIVRQAKLMALYQHFREKGDIDLINDTPELKNQIVKFELLDYMIYYSKRYDSQLKIPKMQYVKTDNDLIVEKYNEKTSKYEFMTSTPVKSHEENVMDIGEQILRQEKNYNKYLVS